MQAQLSSKIQIESPPAEKAAPAEETSPEASVCPFVGLSMCCLSVCLHIPHLHIHTLQATAGPPEEQPARPLTEQLDLERLRSSYHPRRPREWKGFKKA